VSPGGLPIARLFGIEIRVSFTWAILVAIVTFIGAQQAALSAPSLAAPPAITWTGRKPSCASSSRARA